MGRRILSVLVGYGVGALVISVLRVMIYTYFPFPESLDGTLAADRQIYVEGLPDKAYIMMAVSHVLGAFLGSLITALIAVKHRFSSGIITGALIFVTVMVTNFSFSFPPLYVVVDTLVSAVAAFAGASFGQGRQV